MSGQILATKLFIPPHQPKVFRRPRLLNLLNEGIQGASRVILISAPVGYGKTTLVSEWLTDCGRPAGWLSLDKGDCDPARFLMYLIAALQTVAARQSPPVNFGAGELGALQSPVLPPIESILTSLINSLAGFPDKFILVLDDYHVVDAKPIDAIIAFLLQHLPPQMHLMIITREDPNLPLARLRALGQVTELRASDLRFTTDESSTFLNQVMGLSLSAEEVASLENHTEGWIAGLQLAALSMRGRDDVHEFIQAFSGDNRYIVEYLVEEVLQRQTERVRSFLLQTSILTWLSGSLCDAVTELDGSRLLLDTLERSNLFVSPLDEKRLWFRYHPLFADVLHARLMTEQPCQIATLHRRASEWYEHNGLEIEAFQHAAAANDVERARQLIEGKGIPLHFRGGSGPVLKWLASLPTAVLDVSPELWVMYASTLLFSGQHTAVEQKLKSAEAALLAQQGAEPDDRSKDLIGRIASMRATLGVIQHDAETILAQSQRALDYLQPGNLAVRAAAAWSLGYAYQLQGDRPAARQAYNEVIATGKSVGESIYSIAATINLGQLQEADNQLLLASDTYQRVLRLTGDPPDSIACEAFLGLARITYQWDDLEAAQAYGQRCHQLVHQMESVDTFASCGVFLARLRLAHGDFAGADALLSDAAAFIRKHNFLHQMPAVAAVRVRSLLHQGNLVEAAHLAELHDIPVSRARVFLAHENPSAALAILEPVRKKAEAKDWLDEQLGATILEAVAFDAKGEKDRAVKRLGDALALAEPGGFIRIFVDEGQPMAGLLKETQKQGIASAYIRRLLSAFPVSGTEQVDPAQKPSPGLNLVEPLSRRELEVLRLIAQGCSNGEISRRLFLALNTVKGHNQKIFSKLRVQSRTEALVRARELDLL